MKQSAAAMSSYDEMPFGTVLFRFLWPFWLFHNACCGDRLKHAAALRHNRAMRVHLPGYLMKWSFSTALALAVTAVVEQFSSHGAHVDLATVLAAGAGVCFACGLCVLFITSYLYLALGSSKE